MSLFSKLRVLYRSNSFLLEDFHTEIVAQVLRCSDDLTMAWLKWLKVTSLESPRIEIGTQETFEILDGHASASRPDMVIRLRAERKTELIIVESKVDSVQGEDQLQRYADHLAAELNNKVCSKASLVFITRDYEAAEEPTVANLAFQPKFFRTRWFEFYKHLKDHVNGDGLARELKLFMEENHMSFGNQFRSTDLVALENFHSVRALMNETLDGVTGEATKAFAGVSFGGVSYVRKNGTLFRDENCYVSTNGNFTDVRCYIGYWMPSGPTDQSVLVGIVVLEGVNSKDILRAFRKWAPKADWSHDDENEGGAVWKRRPLQTFMSGEDHVQAIKDYFKEALREIDEFKNSHPNLWT